MYSTIAHTGNHLGITAKSSIHTFFSAIGVSTYKQQGKLMAFIDWLL